MEVELRGSEQGAQAREGEWQKVAPCRANRTDRGSLPLGGEGATEMPRGLAAWDKHILANPSMALPPELTDPERERESCEVLGKQTEDRQVGDIIPRGHPTVQPSAFSLSGW